MQPTYYRTFRFSRVPEAVIFAEREAPERLRRWHGETITANIADGEVYFRADYESPLLKSSIEAFYDAGHVVISLGPVRDLPEAHNQAQYAAADLKHTLEQ